MRYATQKDANMMPTDIDLLITPATHDKHRIITPMHINFLVRSSIVLTFDKTHEDRSVLFTVVHNLSFELILYDFLVTRWNVLTIHPHYKC